MESKGFEMGNRKKKSIVVTDLVKGTGSLKRCYETHPSIEFDNGEGKPVGVLVGGNCGHPVHADADVYIGLDWCWTPQIAPPYPWQPAIESKVVEFMFRITDGAAPSDTENAKLLVTWVCGQLREGKKVHIGCIGGHGRTGMMLSAILKEMCGTEDATTWIRENYCKKAVESSSQVEWLHKHYDIKKVQGSKSFLTSVGGTKSYPTYDPDRYSHTHNQRDFGFSGGGYSGYKGSLSAEDLTSMKKGKSSTSGKITPMDSPRNIWKKPA